MLLKILIYLAIFFQFVLMGVLTHLLLTPKKSLGKICWYWLIFSFIGAAGRFFLYEGAVIQIISMLSIMSLWIWIMWMCYKEKLWKRILAICSIFALDIFNEILMSLILMFIVKKDFDVNGASYDRLVVLISVSIMIMLSATVLLRIWKLLAKQEKTPGMTMLLFQLLFLVCMLIGAEYPIWGLGLMVAQRSVFCEIAEILEGICMIYWIYWMVDKSYQASLNESIKEMESKMEENHIYYHAIEQKREAIAKLRHDMNNQILAAKHLIENEDVEEAEALLNQLSVALQKTN